MECHSGQRFYHLEQRNLCAEPERECNPVWDIIQFPVRRRSTAADCQCDDRLLQDRLAHDGWDSGPCRGRHTNPNAYSNSNSDRDCDSNSYCDAYSYSHCYGDRYSYSYTHCYGHRDCYCYTNAYFHTETDTYAKRYAAAKVSADSAAAPLGPDGERCSRLVKWRLGNVHKRSIAKHPRL